MTEPMPEPTDHLPATRRAAVLDIAVELDLIGNPTAALMVRRFAERYPEHDADLADAELVTALSEANAARLDLLAEISRLKEYFQRRTGNLTAARDAAHAENARLHAELKRVRRLLLTALDCWAVEAEMGPHEPGRQRARDQIAQLRERGGLT